MQLGEQIKKDKLMKKNYYLQSAFAHALNFNTFKFTSAHGTAHFVYISL